MNSPPSPRVALIAAVAANGVIGRAGGMPWHLPQDLRYFKDKTMGHRMVMGRRTWESLPGVLPGREHVVVARQAPELPQQVVWAPSLQAALALPLPLPASAPSPTVFVIGGGQVYAQALPLASDVYLTEIGIAIDGDTCFPDWDRSAFEEVARQPFEAPLASGGPAVPVAFVHYRRR